MGKPPRETLRIGAVRGVSRTPAERVGTGKEGRLHDDSHSPRTGSSVSETILSRSGSSSSLNDVHSAWGAVDDYSNNAVESINAVEAFHNNPLGPSLMNFTSLDTGQWDLTNTIGDDLSANLEAELFSSMGWPEFEGSPASTAQTSASPTLVDDGPYLDVPLMPHDESKHHDCLREAYDILGSLSFPNANKTHFATTPAPGATAASTSRVPLDYILHLNREVSKRLWRLLGCSCASFPHLTFIYASVIARVLFCYCQEAGCSTLSSWNLTSDMALLPSLSPTGHLFGSLGGSPSPWLSTVADTANTSPNGSSMPPTMPAAVPDLPPTQMTMGSFSTDDQRVQAALRIQLLLGEMKRIGSLIDTFSSRSCSGMDESTSGNIDALYKSLGSWLAGEHSSIVEAMRTRMKEVGL
ncbi:hypothetical protein DL764_004389 [Monosporascus ibericus]|uniref:Aflatoxin regulatory protein domain-containing protein n=1 Tax=Monosporascus ibericus TaxID=155417 RepID=A0A4Q4TGD1_9PEZI|nr:hypothetical protein DL764_004389 [Monosporascus ibericus]